jgi:hypothetical protein
MLSQNWRLNARFEAASTILKKTYGVECFMSSGKSLGGRMNSGRRKNIFCNIAAAAVRGVFWWI